jgi:C-8 sterol isomerase
LVAELCVVMFSGRFLADDYFTMLHGEQWAFEAGQLEKEVFKPGDQHLMPRGVSKQYRLLEESWALEYARGNVLSMIPFGLIEVFTSTMDVVTLYQTISISLRGIVSNLLRGKV